MTKYLLYLNLCFVILTFSSESFAKSTNEFVIPKASLVTLAPPYINKNYFAFDFGFLTEKKVKSYEYNTYVTATIFQDWHKQADKERAGGLGFRAGVILPFQPWIPLLFTSSLGFSKTVLHQNPFFGNSEKNISKKDMFSIEGGLIYRIDNYLIRGVYQVSNVKYFHRHIIVAVGVYY